MNQVSPTATTTTGLAAVGEGPRIAFVKARWHADLVDACHEGFLREIARLGGDPVAVEPFAVPGAFEIPLLARRLVASGRFAAVVGAAFVVDGGVYRHEFVAATVLEGLMRVQLDSGVPVLSAVLTPHQFQETEVQRRFFLEHLEGKGREVAGACLSVLSAHAALAEAA
ncbi:MAG: 6,7-dimethyl-8-ribityllumazine synthase [Tistlia sp.]|uniref:6,7-dimethyl-8-ribityllumazine synthase n=1 Tax=Tistlia sp. TaxID=3057121 RepID=UPI0034A3AE40